MNPLLILALLAFGASFVFAAVLNAWRGRLVEESQRRPALPSVEGPLPFVSFIVPVRNGQETIAALLQDLHAQEYPADLREVIVVDDASEDRTTAIVLGMQRTWPELSLIAAQGAGKKAAITTGVHVAKGGFMVVTDADARCGPERTMCFAGERARSNADMVLGPVRTMGDGGSLSALQEDEQAGLLAVSAATALGGAAVLASGANMAFTREAFLSVGGYEGDRFASGDDMFLLDRMKRAGKRISFVFDREAITTVEAERSFAGFWGQRMRWAGKMRGVRGGGKWLAALGVLLPWGLLLVTCSIDRTAAVNQGLFRAVLLIAAAWVLWIVPVLGLVAEAKHFLGLPPRNARTMISFVCFTCYAPAIAMASLVFRPRWKGRGT